MSETALVPSDIKCLFAGAVACSSCHAFYRMFNEHTHVRAAGAGIHGISRSAFNKLVCFNFHTDMHKLFRNGNRWKLVRESLTSFFDSDARLSEQEDVEDRKILSTVFNTMLSHNVENCVDLLREFEQYKAGPVGRGKGLVL